MAKEIYSEWMLYAKAHAAAEKSMGIEKWVQVSYYIDIPEKEDGAVCLQSHGSQWSKLVFLYDMPRHQYDRYLWVIRWRYARLVCQYPRCNVQYYVCFYDKTTGLGLGFGEALSDLTAAKALLSRYKNRLKDYIESQSSNIFFNGNDDVVEKFNAKIRNTELKIQRLESQVKEMVAAQKAENADVPF